MGPTNSTINNYEILNESIETQSSGGETDELNDCDFSDFDDQETFADFIDEKDSLHSAFITLPDGSLRHKQNCCNADVNKISKPSTDRIFRSMLSDAQNQDEDLLESHDRSDCFSIGETIISVIALYCNDKC